MIVNNYYQILKSNHYLIDLRSQSEFEKKVIESFIIPLKSTYLTLGKSFFDVASAIAFGSFTFDNSASLNQS